jgi:hypothetical protein
MNYDCDSKMKALLRSNHIADEQKERYKFLAQTVQARAVQAERWTHFADEGSCANVSVDVDGKRLRSSNTLNDQPVV